MAEWWCRRRNSPSIKKTTPKKQKTGFTTLGTTLMEFPAKTWGLLPNAFVTILTKTMTSFRAAKRRSNANLPVASAWIFTTFRSTGLKTSNAAANTPIKTMTLTKSLVPAANVKHSLRVGDAVAASSLMSIRLSVNCGRRRRKKGKLWGSSKGQSLVIVVC